MGACFVTDFETAAKNAEVAFQQAQKDKVQLVADKKAELTAMTAAGYRSPTIVEAEERRNKARAAMEQVKKQVDDKIKGGRDLAIKQLGLNKQLLDKFAKDVAEISQTQQGQQKFRSQLAEIMQEYEKIRDIYKVKGSVKATKETKDDAQKQIGIENARAKEFHEGAEALKHKTDEDCKDLISMNDALKKQIHELELKAVQYQKDNSEYKLRRATLSEEIAVKAEEVKRFDALHSRSQLLEMSIRGLDSLAGVTAHDADTHYNHHYDQQHPDYQYHDDHQHHDYLHHDF